MDNVDHPLLVATTDEADSSATQAIAAPRGGFGHRGPSCLVPVENLRVTEAPDSRNQSLRGDHTNRPRRACRPRSPVPDAIGRASVTGEPEVTGLGRRRGRPVDGAAHLSGPAALAPGRRGHRYRGAEPPASDATVRSDGGRSEGGPCGRSPNRRPGRRAPGLISGPNCWWRAILRPRPGSTADPSGRSVAQDRPLDSLLQAAGGPPTAARTPVLAVGSNASPAQVRRKMANAGLATQVPITAVRVRGLTVGVSAHVSRPGTCRPPRCPTQPRSPTCGCSGSTPPRWTRSTPPNPTIAGSGCRPGVPYT